MTVRDRLARLPFADAWSAAGEPTPDVMSVRSRLAMYRWLVEDAPSARGLAVELNPFWGYASQLAWQHASGRLGTGDRIADTSWWGACNFALSVVPYAAARGEPVPAAYAPVAATWVAAFHALAAGADPDTIRRLTWRAHLASITLAVGLHARELAALPAAEQRFARGWVRMVDLFAAAALRTDLDKLVETGGGALPSRILDGDDLADLPRHERSTVRRVGALADRPRWRWALELSAWRRVMRTRAARADAEPLLAGLLGAGTHVWPARARAMLYGALPAFAVERLFAS